MTARKDKTQMYVETAKVSGVLSVKAQGKRDRGQVGGNHYKLPIEPIDFIHANGMPFMDGNIVKYISRHRRKNGAEDIRKIKEYCDLILELEYGE